MGHAIAVFLWVLALSAGLITMGWVMCFQLGAEASRSHTRQWLLGWTIKGMVLPWALWGVMNWGISWSLQPFMPQIQAAQSRGGAWFPEFLSVVTSGLFIVSSYWTATTLGWRLLQTSRGLEEESHGRLKSLYWTCLIGMGVPALIILLLGGWPALGLSALAVLAPMAGYTPKILRPKKLPPMYARAVARMKFGKYAEAEWEIIRELEKSEDDFEGWMLLADLYANNFRDIAEAEQTILEICDQPKTSPTQLSVALHRLADWHLKWRSDPDAARRALRVICERLPRTHLAHMAQLRINQLPLTAEDLREQQASKPIPLPALREDLEEPTQLEPQLDPGQAAAKAKHCVEILNQNPNHLPAREELARLLAEQLHQVDDGLEQLRLLLALPDQPEVKRAEWLSLMAAWHLKYQQDRAAGRTILEQLVRELPNTPQAFAAQRKLFLMDMELKQKS